MVGVGISYISLEMGVEDWVKRLLWGFREEVDDQ